MEAALEALETAGSSGLIDELNQLKEAFRLQGSQILTHQTQYQQVKKRSTETN